MIKDKSSGYGWGNGMMYIKGNPGGKSEEFVWRNLKMWVMKNTWIHLPDSMQTLPQPVDHRDGWIRLPQGDTWGEKHPSIPKPCHHTRWKATLYLKFIFWNTGEYRFLTDGHLSWTEARVRCHNIDGFLAEYNSLEDHFTIFSVIQACRQVN